MNKRIISGLAAIALVFSGGGAAVGNIVGQGFDIAASAEGVENTIDTDIPTSGTCGDDLTWNYSDGTLTIGGTGEMYDFNAGDSPGPWEEFTDDIKTVIISDGVTSIGRSAFLGCNSLTDVTLPDSLTSIGNFAFMNCENLSNINLTDGLTHIGYGAFWSCKSLTGIDIPNSVTYIGDFAFSDCPNLTSIIIPESVTTIGKAAFCYCSGIDNIIVDENNPAYTAVDGVLYDKDLTLLMQCPESKSAVTIPDSVTGIAFSAFGNCKNITSIVLPDGVTSIDDVAFCNCSGLAEINLPDGLTKIGQEAFLRCSSLTSLIIPDSVTDIGSDTFRNCSALTSVTLPSGLTSISDYMFDNCENLTALTIPDGVKTIGAYAFYGCKSLSEIILPDSVESIGDRAFLGCHALTSVSIPNGVTEISQYMFALCIGLTEINIPDSVTVINKYAFWGCKALESVNIPYGVTTIGSSAFAFCYDLKDVTIPNSVTSIKNEAFEYCDSLKEITIPDSVTELGNMAFWGCMSLTDIFIPKSVTSIGYYQFEECTNLTNIDVDPENPEFSSEDGILYNKDLSTLLWFPAKRTDITIPGSVTSIGEDAFCYTSLSSIDIPTNITSIGESAFYNSDALTSVTIPESVTEIGEVAFYGCTSLKSVYLPRSLTSIGECAFGYKTEYDDSNHSNDVKLDDFKIYCYKDTAGEAYAVENGIEYELLDEIAAENPDVVSNPGNNCAKLEWNAVNGAEKYAVCGLVDGKWQKLAETTDTSYVLNSLKADKEYKVAVIAKTGGKWLADFSKAITVTARQTLPSKYPNIKDIIYNDEYHQFRIIWGSVPDAEKYVVAVKVAGKWKTLTPTEKTVFTSPKLKPGKTYEMVVCAKVNGVWDTNKINERAFTVTVK